jgi:hypothetical protein
VPPRVMGIPVILPSLAAWCIMELIASAQRMKK